MRKELAEKLQAIFAVKKVSFDMPGDKVKGAELVAPEQDVLFVNLVTDRSRFKDGRIISKVQGTAFVCSNHDKMPHGYFAKQIALARPELVADFFFFNFESNEMKYRDLVERSLSFIYLSSGDFDPNLGKIEGIVIADNFGG